MSAEVLIPLTIIIIILTVWIRWRKKKMNIFTKNGIPGPQPSLITGNIKEFNEKRHKCLQGWIGKYGKIFGFFLGGKPCIVCSDVNFLKLMQIKEFKNFVNRDGILPDLGIPHESIHNILVLSRNEEWKNLRSILSTSFSSGKIKLMTTIMSDPIDIFLRNIDKQKEQPFNVMDMYKKLTFDITCRTQFGIESNVQNEESTKFIKSLSRLLEPDTTDILAILSILFPELEPIPTKLRLAVDFIKHMLNLTCVRLVFDTCRKIVHSRKKSNIRAVDLLQNMIDAEDDSREESKKLLDDCVIANSVVFMIAGFDGLSAILSWCTYYMAIHQDVQEKVRQEIINTTEKSVEIQYSDLIKFQYMDQVLSETLRLFPIPTFAVNRTCEENFKYNDMIIPKNATILVPVPILHNDPDYWENPEEFEPDRFSPENSGKINNLVYQPFGAGPRNCIGSKLAQTILKLILANFIRSYRLQLYGDKEIQMEHHMLLSRPKNGIVIKAYPINS